MGAGESLQERASGAYVEQVRAWARMVNQRRWLALAVAACCAAAAVAMLQVYRDRYESTARVYVDTQTVLKPLMAGLTYQPDIDQQLRMLARTLISRENVERLIATPGLELTPMMRSARRRSAGS